MALFLPPERKRFYQNVSISQGEGGFEINLDHRKLKTPQAKLFTVPSEALAIAVATEWDSQKDTIKFYTMHLTTLCNTALDNPTQRNKTQLIRAAVKFLETDTVCYRVEEPAALAELQKNEWDPVVAWAEKRYNVAIGSSTSILGPNIPASTKETFISHLASYNMWALQGVPVCGICSSPSVARRSLSSPEEGCLASQKLVVWQERAQQLCPLPTELSQDTAHHTHLHSVFLGVVIDGDRSFSTKQYPSPFHPGLSSEL
ncbi:ATP synthase mitochondrial F1 complex assembly factor 2 [Egretta garzetta]|uniref:ATP synthase mitochondrial F1 complex assembly factor 2 n=1 Tax=Egretta garzetta TaxID=188379 RepID=UPI00163C1B2B|nr:ATP synthase mitochondrial F1 complex assembly factor 2 [Egretta garzetta]